MKPDNFVVTGLQGLKKFGVRAQLKNGELRGYTVHVRPDDGRHRRAGDGGDGQRVRAVSRTATTPIAALSKPVDYGSGLIVSADGHILTDRRLAENCNVIAVAGLGNAERVAIDRAAWLALLRVYGKRELEAAALSREPPASGDLTLVGVPDPHIQSGGKEARRSESAARRRQRDLAARVRAGRRLLRRRRRFDGKGRVLGIMETRNAQLASARARPAAGAARPRRRDPRLPCRAYNVAPAEPATPAPPWCA